MSRPNLARRASGKCILTICSATACAAAFSLVQIMIDNVGSMAIKPTITAAAALVLPAPNTPALHRSVRPVISASVSPTAEARRCRSGAQPEA